MISPGKSKVIDIVSHSGSRGNTSVLSVVSSKSNSKKITSIIESSPNLITDKCSPLPDKPKSRFKGFLRGDFFHKHRPHSEKKNEKSKVSGGAEEPDTEKITNLESFKTEKEYCNSIYSKKAQETVLDRENETEFENVQNSYTMETSNGHLSLNLLDTTSTNGEKSPTIETSLTSTFTSSNSSSSVVGSKKYRKGIGEESFQIKNITEGLQKLSLDEDSTKQDLDNKIECYNYLIELFEQTNVFEEMGIKVDNGNLSEMIPFVVERLIDTVVASSKKEREILKKIDTLETENQLEANNEVQKLNKIIKELEITNNEYLEREKNKVKKLEKIKDENICLQLKINQLKNVISSYEYYKNKSVAFIIKFNNSFKNIFDQPNLPNEIQKAIESLETKFMYNDEYGRKLSKVKISTDYVYETLLEKEFLPSMRRCYTTCVAQKNIYEKQNEKLQRKVLKHRQILCEIKKNVPI